MWGGVGEEARKMSSGLIIYTLKHQSQPDTRRCLRIENHAEKNEHPKTFPPNLKLG